MAMRTTILSLICAMSVACGGASPEPKAPTTDSAEPAPAPEATPAPAPDPVPAAASTPSQPVKTSAVSNTKDGSDIIPPFTAAKTQDDDSTAKPAAPADPPKKKAAKTKKKA